MLVGGCEYSNLGDVVLSAEVGAICEGGVVAISVVGGAGAPATAERKVYRGSSLSVAAREATADSCVPSKVVIIGWDELLLVVVAVTSCEVTVVETGAVTEVVN